MNTCKIIEAQPGWKSVAPVYGENDLIDELYEIDIIGWIINIKPFATKKTYYPNFNDEHIVEVIPVTIMEGVISKRSVMKSPDGIYSIPEGITFENEADVLEYFKKQEQEYSN